MENVICTIYPIEGTVRARDMTGRLVAAIYEEYGSPPRLTVFSDDASISIGDVEIMMDNYNHMKLLQQNEHNP